MKHILFTLMSIAVSIGLSSQSNVNIDFTKEKNIKAVIIANINGNVTVTGNNNGKLTLRGDKIIDDKDDKKVNLSHTLNNDTLIIYIESPCSTLRTEGERKFLKESWSVYNWEKEKRCDNQPEFKFNLSLSVPHDIPVAVSTINEGDVIVEDYKGHLWANNINGSVSLKNVIEVHKARTINGDVTIHFSKSPSVDGKYYTLNGDIESFYPKGVNMDMTFKTFMGDFYTDADNLETLPRTISKEKSNKGFKLKVGEKSTMRIGKGGLVQNFETFNGDAIVRTKSI